VSPRRQASDDDRDRESGLADALARWDTAQSWMRLQPEDTPPPRADDDPGPAARAESTNGTGAWMFDWVDRDPERSAAGWQPAAAPGLPGSGRPAVPFPPPPPLPAPRAGELQGDGGDGFWFDSRQPAPPPAPDSWEAILSADQHHGPFTDDPWARRRTPVSAVHGDPGASDPAEPVGVGDDDQPATPDAPDDSARASGWDGDRPGDHGAARIGEDPPAGDPPGDDASGEPPAADELAGSDQPEPRLAPVDQAPAPAESTVDDSRPADESDEWAPWERGSGAVGSWRPAEPAGAAADTWSDESWLAHLRGAGPESEPPAGPADQAPGPDQPGSDQPGSDQPGPDQLGPERPGPDQPGPDQLGPERPGPDQLGPERPGPDQPGPDQLGPDQPPGGWPAFSPPDPGHGPTGGPGLPPQGRLPQGGLPQGGPPQGGFPQGGLPQGGLPQRGLPQGGLPPQGTEPYGPPHAPPPAYPGLPPYGDAGPYGPPIPYGTPAQGGPSAHGGEAPYGAPPPYPDQSRAGGHGQIGGQAPPGGPSEGGQTPLGGPGQHGDAAGRYGGTPGQYGGSPGQYGGLAAQLAGASDQYAGASGQYGGPGQFGPPGPYGGPGPSGGPGQYGEAPGQYGAPGRPGEPSPYAQPGRSGGPASGRPQQPAPAGPRNAPPADPRFPPSPGAMPYPREFPGPTGYAPRPGYPSPAGHAPPPPPPTVDELTAQSLLKQRRPTPQSGWRRAVYTLSAHAVNPGQSPAELHRKAQIERATVPVRGCHRIAVISLKGGVGKTTTTVCLGATLASLRGDRVIAVDANPDRGTLSGKLALETVATVRNLLNDADQIQHYFDVRRYTSQSPDRLEVLASESDPAVSVAFSEQDFRRVAAILERFYNIVLTDSGTGLLHSAMAGVLALADQIVLVSSGSVDGARSASATLDWLEAHGRGELVRGSVAVINSVRPKSGGVDLDKLEAHFAARCRAVSRIPYDPHLEEGAEVDLGELRSETRDALLELAAAVADGFPRDNLPTPSLARHSTEQPAKPRP
jgi:MinD-like ATPase involved in chromosome partitioning or flagellar assembly